MVGAVVAAIRSPLSAKRRGPYSAAMNTEKRREYWHTGMRQAWPGECRTRETTVRAEELGEGQGHASVGFEDRYGAR